MTDVQAGFTAAPLTMELIGADGHEALPQIGVTHPVAILSSAFTPSRLPMATLAFISSYPSTLLQVGTAALVAHSCPPVVAFRS